VLAAMVGFVIGKHRPHVRQSQSLKLAMPLPCLLAVGPSVFEGKPVRFHREPPSNLPVPWSLHSNTICRKRPNRLTSAPLTDGDGVRPGGDDSYRVLAR